MQDLNSNKPGGKQLPGDRMLSVLGMDDLTPTEIIVLTAVSYHDGPGGCRPSIERLGGLLGMNRFKISNYLSAIREKGRIDWRKTQRGNEYTIFYSHPAVRKILTAETEQENHPAVRKFDSPAVRKSLTQREGREEGNKPGYQERNVSTAKTRSNGILVGYTEEVLSDGTRITVPMYE